MDGMEYDPVRDNTSRSLALAAFALLAIIVGAYALNSIMGGGGPGGTDLPVSANQQVLRDVDSLALKNSKIFDTLIAAGCTRTNKYEDRWIIDGCTDPDVYFRIDLPRERYVISYCAKAQTQRERFTKLSQYLEKECVGNPEEDALLKDLGDTQIHSACGWRLTVKGECILGVGGL